MGWIPGVCVSDETRDAILTVYHAGITSLKRIRGELMKCGITVSKTTIRKVLRQHGLPPGKSGGTPKSTWSRFLRLHADRIFAVDFIQMPVGWISGIANAFVFFGIEHDTRRVHILGVTLNPTGDWIANVVRSATMDGMPLASRKHWIHDQDGKLYYPLPAALKSTGLKSVMTSIQAPDMNAFAERWVRSARHDCLDQIIFRDVDHLKVVAREYVEHYNTERPHQGIGNVPIGPWVPQTEGEIVCDERLHGLLKSFRRAA